jgi:hypothetical protein
LKERLLNFKVFETEREEEGMIGEGEEERTSFTLFLGIDAFCKLIFVISRNFSHFLHFIQYQVLLSFFFVPLPFASWV